MTQQQERPRLDPESQAAFDTWWEAEGRKALAELAQLACPGSPEITDDAWLWQRRAQEAHDHFVVVFSAQRLRDARIACVRPSGLRTMLEFGHA